MGTKRFCFLQIFLITILIGALFKLTLSTESETESCEDFSSNENEVLKVYIIRHGEGHHNVPGANCNSLRDPHLTKRGILQAKGIFDSIPVNPDVVFFSPLTRTIETTLHGFSRLMGENSNVSFVPYSYLGLFGKHCNTGRGVNVIQEEFPMFDFSALDKGWFEESRVSSAQKRKMFVKFLLEYLEINPDTRRIAIVTHMGTIRGLLGVKFLKMENAKVLHCEFYVNNEEFACK